MSSGFSPTAPWLQFQRSHCVGTVLNVGCGGDCARLAQVGAYNVDICDRDPVSGVRNPIHEIADARDLRFADGEFDTVVIGEVLEHLQPEDTRRAVAECIRVARKRVVITCPDDHRPVEVQRGLRGEISGTMSTEVDEYAPGCATYHRPLALTELVSHITAAMPLACEGVDYTVEAMPTPFGYTCFGVIVSLEDYPCTSTS